MSTTKSKLTDVKLGIADVEELKLNLSAARHCLDPLSDGFTGALAMEKAANLATQIAERLKRHYRGSPRARYSRHKAGDGDPKPWS